MVLVDTSVWFPWFVESDSDHGRVTAWLEQNPAPLITTDYIIDETLTLFVARKHVQRAMHAGRVLFHQIIATIHYVTPSQIQRTWILFQQRAAAGWSFTDCTSKIVIDDRTIAKAAALDDHFRQFGNVTVVP